MNPSDFPRFTTPQIADLFGVSLETIRAWCSEFERHLSPRANPGHRQRRAFSENDLEVLALISALKEDGMTFRDIHAALDNGERGVVPALELENTAALAPRENSQALVIRVQVLEEELEEVREENERLRQELEDSRRDSLRNEVRAEMLQEQLGKIEQRVKELLDERARLDREIGSMQSDLRRRNEPGESV